MKRGTPNHPKTHDLAERLGLAHWGAVGILESLWHFAYAYAPRGDVGRHADAVIAKAIGWRDDPAALISALVRARFLDRCRCHRLRIHDWHDHLDQTGRRKDDVKRLGLIECYGDASVLLAVDYEPASPPVPVPLPVPTPTPVPTPAPNREPDGPPACQPDPTTERVRGEMARALAVTVEATGRDPEELLVQASTTPRGQAFRLVTQTDSVPWMRTTIERLLAIKFQADGRSRAGPPVNPKAAERKAGMAALIQGGLDAGRDVGQGHGRACGELPEPGSGPGGDAGEGRRLPPGAGQPDR